MDFLEREKASGLPPINGAANEPNAPPRKPRPVRTAPPRAVGRLKWNPYESTMKHDFDFKPTSNPETDCARAGKGYVIPFQVDEPTENSIYKDEFGWKPYSKAKSMWTAEKSMRNNPQPGDRFLVCQLPQEESPLCTYSCSPWAIPATKEQLEKVVNSQYKSLYATDYGALHQGALNDAVTAPPDWKTFLPRPLNTEFRRHYQPQPQVPELMNYTWKYGCNANRRTPVKGAVPSLTLAQIWSYDHSKQLSTYQRDFGKDNVLTTVNSLNPEEIKAYVERAPKPEKLILQKFLDQVSGDKTFQRPSSSKRPEGNPIKSI